MCQHILTVIFVVLFAGIAGWSAEELTTPTRHYVMKPMSVTNSSSTILTAVYVDGLTNRAATIPELTNLLARLPQGSSLSYRARHGQFGFRLGTNRFQGYQILKDLCASNHIAVQSILIPDW